mmetsp:Transcript_27002/g.56702  ORF Transcript_27002/g.56702 Transcript_27002/m.56702 type:complete len:80 (-) Transcript_27002:3513-3752(-)
MSLDDVFIMSNSISFLVIGHVECDNNRELFNKATHGEDDKGPESTTFHYLILPLSLSWFRIILLLSLRFDSDIGIGVES